MDKQKLLKIAQPIIQKIAQNRSSRSFAYYESIDIKQEVWVFCLEALDKYDQTKCTPNLSIEEQIERFLNHHVSNRIKNLMRDKYFSPDLNNLDKSKTRMNIVNALPIDICNNNNIIKFFNSYSDCFSPEENLIFQEMKDFIFDRLPKEFKDIFIDFVNNNKIRKTVEIELKNYIAEILKDFNNE